MKDNYKPKNLVTTLETVGIIVFFIPISILYWFVCAFGWLWGSWRKDEKH